MSLGNGTISADDDTVVGNEQMPPPEMATAASKQPTARSVKYNTSGSSIFPSFTSSSPMPEGPLVPDDVSMSSMSSIGDEDGGSWLPIGISWRDFDEGEFKPFPKVEVGDNPIFSVMEEPTTVPGVHVITEVSPPAGVVRMRSHASLARAINKLTAVFIDLCTVYAQTEHPLLFMSE